MKVVVQSLKISYAPIFVMEEKDRKEEYALKNMLKNISEVRCIVEYVFKVTVNDFSQHVMDFY